MKLIRFISVLAVTILTFTACNEGIDPITPVAQGTDTANPIVSLTYPTEGTAIQVREAVTSITLTGTITDDIELKSVVIKLDGTQITSFDTFKDYRRFLLNYTYNNVTNGTHVLTVIATDLSGKATTQVINFEKKAPYVPIYGEIFYMPFNGSNMDLVSITYPTVVGTPSFTTGKKGQAYAGTTGSYLTFPATGLKNASFSAIFWLNVNTTPDRAGILNISQDGTDDRTQGFRFFREGSSTSQTIKLNVGTGSGENWIDITTVGPTDGWKQYAFSISATTTNLFVDGVLVKTVAGGIAWNDLCTTMSIGSGMPNFAYWSHLSELSPIDELRIFDRALTATEVQTIYNAEK